MLTEAIQRPSFLRTILPSWFPRFFAIFFSLYWLKHLFFYNISTLCALGVIAFASMNHNSMGR